MCGETSANGGKEAGMVWDERCWLGRRPDGDRMLEVADTDLGCGRGGRSRVEKGSSKDHAGGC